jgi:hypothetical protein
MTAWGRASTPSPALRPPAGDEQHDAGGTSDNAMLVMNARNTGFMARKKARQLVGGKDEIEAGNDEEHDADKREDDFHELIPLEYDALELEPDSSHFVNGKANESGA